MTSVFSKYLSRTAEQVHKYGEDIATSGNERVKKSHAGDLPINKKSYYLGFYELFCGPVQGVEMENYQIQIGWRPENDNDAHFQIEMSQNADGGSKSQRRNDRTAAIEKMAQLLQGPTVPEFSEDDHRQGLAENLPIRTSIR